jgi:Uma2 family endonuclease
MSKTTDQVTTAEQLAARPDDGNRYELVEGIVRMMSPAGNRHGRIAAKLHVRITNHVEQRNLGATYAAETGFLIQRSPDTVRAPDVAFVACGRLEAFANHVGYLPLAPDIVAEVVSPSDSSSDVEAKVQGWLDAGVRVVLAVDPQNSTVREYRSASQIRAYSGGFVDLDDVLPSFQLDVAELFA